MIYRANNIDTESRGTGCPWKYIVRVSVDNGESFVMASPEYYADASAAEKAAAKHLKALGIFFGPEPPQ